jgi:hypothetical protein
MSGLAGHPGCGAAGFDGPGSEAVPVTDKLVLVVIALLHSRGSPFPRLPDTA